MNDKAMIYKKKMEILLSLRGFSITKINEIQALWRINSNDRVTIDVSFPPKLWEVNHRGKKLDDWKSDPVLLASTRSMIQALEDDFVNACEKVGIVILPEGNDEISPEVLAELRKELSELLAKLEQDEAEPGVEEPDKEDSKLSDENQSTSLTPGKAPVRVNGVDVQLIKIIDSLLKGITNPSIVRKNGSVAACDEVKA